MILIILSSSLAVRVNELTHLNMPGAPTDIQFIHHLLTFCYLPGKVLDLYLSAIYSGSRLSVERSGARPIIFTEAVTTVLSKLQQIWRKRTLSLRKEEE